MQITVLMEQMAQDNPDIAELITLKEENGDNIKTHEDREIQMIKVLVVLSQKAVSII